MEVLEREEKQPPVLHGHYNIKKSDILKLDRICKGDMLELAKITSLLLCSAVQCPSNEHFVEPITKLDQDSQTNLMEIIQHIIVQAEDNSLRHDFANILYKKGEPMWSDDSKSEVECASPALPMFIPESPFLRQSLNQSPMMSPIRKFMSSPQMTQKISLRKLQDRVQKLQLRIGEEIALRQDREAELREKNAILDLKDVKIRELMVNKNSQQQFQDEVDEHQATKLELEKFQREVVRLRKKTANTGESRAMVAHLQKQVENLMSERDELKTNMKNYHILRSECERLKVSLHKAEYTNEEQQSVVTQLSQEMELMAKAKEEASKTAVQKQEILQEKLARLEDELAERNLLNRSQGESMGMIAEKRILDLEVEIERLKSTWIEPGCHAALDKNFKEVCQTKKNKIEALKEELCLARNKAEKIIEDVREKLQKTQKELDVVRNQLLEEKSDKENMIAGGTLEFERLQTQSENSQSLLLQQIKVTTDEKEKLRMDLQKIETEKHTIVADLENQVKSLREKQKHQMMQFVEKMELAKSQSDKIGLEHHQQIEDVMNQLQTKTEKILSLESEMDVKVSEMQGSLANKDSEIEKLKEQLDAVKTSFEADLKQKVQILSQVNQELIGKSEKVDAEQEKNTALVEEIARLNTELETLTDEKEKLRMELQKIETEKHTIVADLENQVKSLREKQKHQMMQFVEKMELAKSQSDKIGLEHLQQIEDVMNQLQTKTEKILSLESEMDVKVSEMQGSLANKDSGIEKLKEQLDAVKTSFEADLKQKEQILSQVNQELIGESEKVDAELEKNSALVEEIARLNTELETLTESHGRNNNELTQKLNELTTNLQQANSSNIVLKDEFDKQNAQFIEMKVILETEVTEERNLTKNLREELNRKNYEIDDKTTEWEQREAELMKKVKEVTILLSGEQRKCQNLKEELKVLREESNNNAKKNQSSMQKREELLTQRNAELKEKLNELETQYEQNLSAMEFSTKEMRRKWEELRKNSEQRHEKEIYELQERYNREIETTKRGDAVKEDLLKQELEAARLELTQTKKQCKRESESLKEKKKVLEITANEQLAAKHKEMEKELHRYKKRMEKEAQQFKAEAEKLQKELTKTCTEANTYKSDLERHANEKLQEMKDELEKGRTDLSEKIFLLENENHNMKCKLEKLHKKALASNSELTEQRSAKEQLVQRVCSLQTQLDFSHRQLTGQVNHTMDSLDGSLGLSMEDLRPSSRGSISSLDSNASGVSTISKSKGRTTIIINMSKTSTSLNTTQELNTSSTSVVSKGQSLHHLDIAPSNTSKCSLNKSQLSLASAIEPSKLSLASSLGPEYPESLSRTLDQLSASQAMLLSSKKTDSPESRATTGRLGFFMTHSQGEEPEDFDWDRLSELKRRNTLCLPHLQTSYPAETQACEKETIDLKTTKVLEGAAGMPSYQLRQTRKRKSSGVDDLEKSSKLRSTVSQPTLSGQVIKLSNRRSTSLQTVHNQKMSTSSLVQESSEQPSFHKTSSIRPNAQEEPMDVTFTIPAAMAPKAKKTGGKTHSKRVGHGKPPNGRKPLLTSSKVNSKPKEPEVTDPRRESVSFSIGFSPKPQFKRRSSRMSFGKGLLKSTKSTEKNKNVNAEEGKETPKTTPRKGKDKDTNTRRRTIGNLLKWKE